MTKLLKWTLKNLNKENKIKLKDIIRNWDKQNFRILVKDIWENKKDVNE